MFCESREDKQERIDLALNRKYIRVNENFTSLKFFTYKTIIEMNERGGFT